MSNAHIQYVSILSFFCLTASLSVPSKRKSPQPIDPPLKRKALFTRKGLSQFLFDHFIFYFADI